MPSLLRGVLRQSRGEGGGCRGSGCWEGHVLLLSHVALGTVVGKWQEGEENTTHRQLWAWGLGEQDCCGAGASSSPGFIKGKNKTQSDRAATNNQNSSALCLCVPHRETEVTYACTPIILHFLQIYKDS